MFASRILAVAAVVAAVAPTAVFAAPATTSAVTIVDDETSIVRRMNVQTDDLNLASAAGQRTLRRRVTHAVSEVCSPNTLPDNFENARCRQVAMADAKVQVADAMARATHYAQATPARTPATTASGS